MATRLLYLETMAVQWVSEGLGRFFSNQGFHFYSDTVGEKKEAKVPLDRIYAAKKGRELFIFAFQFKAPYKKGDFLGWKLDSVQQSNLACDFYSRFIYYCFPYMKNPSEWKNILYLSHFVNPNICPGPINWFIWDDYFLYFYPGQGGCNNVIENFMPLPCIGRPLPLIDRKLRAAHNSKWNYALNYDSWGSLYYKLSSGEYGFILSDDNSYEKAGRFLSGENAENLDDKAIIILMDVVEKTVNAINIIGRSTQETDEEAFPFEG
jgi:hypothetical protein